MIEVSGTGLRPREVVEVARFGVPVLLAAAARERMEQSAAVLARLAASEQPVYGVSTGFGSLANTHIPAERREERTLASDYETQMRTAVGKLTPANLSTVIALAAVPDMIKGYGHVKEANIALAKQRRQELLDAMEQASRSAAGPAQQVAHID